MIIVAPRNDLSLVSGYSCGAFQAVTLAVSGRNVCCIFGFKLLICVPGKISGAIRVRIRFTLELIELR